MQFYYNHLNFISIDHVDIGGNKRLMNQFLFVGLLFFTTVHGQDKEQRRSIYFGGGRYYVDDANYRAVHWVDSIPDLLDEIHSD
jgi:hypothetical protein